MALGVVLAVAVLVLRAAVTRVFGVLMCAAGCLATGFVCETFSGWVSAASTFAGATLGDAALVVARLGAVTTGTSEGGASVLVRRERAGALEEPGCSGLFCDVKVERREREDKSTKKYFGASDGFRTHYLQCHKLAL